MPSIRFRLDNPPASGLAERVRQEYGPDARILDVQEHVVGGMGGFFGQRVVDVTVDIPDPVAPEDAHAFDLPRRVGIMALLEDADAADDAPRVPAPPAVSTERGEFASVLDGLRIDVEPAASAGGGTPARPLRRPRAERQPSGRRAAVPDQPPAPRRARHAQPPAPTVAAPPLPVPPLPVPPMLAAPEPFAPDPRVALTAPLDRPATRAALRAASAPEPSPPEESGAPEPELRRDRTRRAELELEPAPLSAPPAVPATLPSAQAIAQFEWATPSPRSRVGRMVPGVAPEARRGAGDLLLLVGQGDAAVGVAKAVRDRLRSGYVCDGGVVEGYTRRRVDDRRGALAARAYGVRSEQPVIVAYGVDGDLVPDGLLEIDGDQAWLVVDAAADPDETLRFADGLRGRLQIDAIAGLHAGGPSVAIERIGLPVAWTDRSLGRIPA